MSEQLTQSELVEVDNLLEKAKDVPKPTAQDLRAAFFKKHENELLYGLKHIKLNALKRCVAAVALGELSQKQYKPQTPLEKNFVNHFNECVKLRAQMIFEEEMSRLTQAWEKEQADLEKINEITVSSLSEDAKKELVDNGIDLNKLTDTKGVL